MQLTVNGAEATSKSPDSKPNRPGFRADIQGLRALAVGIVLLYHLWPNRFVGGFIGVDVFFVISGFLITSHLIKSPPKNWRDVADFWARRIRRLLPASLLVLFFVGVSTFLVAPQSIWVDTGRQIFSAALYVVNWDFANSSVDYLAADNAPSPVQHFWSLSVEEQFYFVWPVIIGLAFLLGAKIKRARTVVGFTVVGIFIASLIFSVWYTVVQPAMAYFITPTRMWELAAGGLVAVFVIYVRPKRLPFSSLVGWAGLAGIVAGTFLIRADMPFPGYIALVPVVSTALVILADSRGRYSVLPLLSLRPAQFLGDISYSVYLWHWPLIVLVPYLSEKVGATENLGRLDKAVIILFSLAVAWASTTWVENRFRKTSLLRSPKRTFGFAIVAMALVSTLGLSQMWVSDRIVEQNEDKLEIAMNDPDSCLGAAALLPSAKDNPKCDDMDSLMMEPAAAKDDKSKAYADGCWASEPYTDRPECTYGDGKKHVALVGNSHAGHWLPTLERLAEKNDWTITTFLASNCSISTLPQDLGTPEGVKGCQDYSKWVEDRTTSGEFDAVITSERQSTPLDGKSWEETEREAPEGHRKILQSWIDAKLDVVVVRDTPYPGGDDIQVPDCVAKHEDDLEKCSGTPESWHWMDPLAASARTMDSKNLSIIYPEDWFCPDGRCEPVIGGVITYFDTAHITATYAKTLAPQFDDRLRRSGLDTFD
ncbi:acyltransferase family protein [Brevibacterium marinum]|uniref:Peptidoglycan/LPS O-acetylase OafA/YrhL n=1 Tax=Brevibacterium marinum TaxID=418643 RepID=A0A846RR11_9MICO|nr:acyltransferase family protein [Brevibacterium marinum]NJC56424.1 peptidoglycan/LPS O-acetylase OafA/YrhL [Brevibacterium marinum]